MSRPFTLYVSRFWKQTETADKNERFASLDGTATSEKRQTDIFVPG